MLPEIVPRHLRSLVRTAVQAMSLGSVIGAPDLHSLPQAFPILKPASNLPRCGSQKHTLSRCRTPADPENPFPFASCFVCSGKGHLAGSCPQNQNKGVYPNGGSCKICGGTTHLAKDCTVRKDGKSLSRNCLILRAKRDVRSGSKSCNRKWIWCWC